MFSAGSYSGVPGQMCCSMLWMGPREGSVQFICRSVQLCCPVASLRIQVALLQFLSMWQISVIGYPPQAILMKTVRLFVWESKNSLLLPQVQNNSASLTPIVLFFLPTHCVWHWGASQPHLFILDTQLKTDNKFDQLRTDAEVCISSRKRSCCLNHKNTEQCRSANSIKMAIMWTM